LATFDRVPCGIPMAFSILSNDKWPWFRFIQLVMLSGIGFTPVRSRVLISRLGIWLF